MSISLVAKRAGVSIATVSRVINQFPGVSPRTAKMVKTAMRELSYVPAAVRPGPKPGSVRTIKLKVRHGAIAVLTVGQASRDWLTLPLMASAFAQITAAAKARNLKLLIDEMPDAGEASSLLAGREIDGAIVFWSARLGRNSVDTLRAYGIPLVWMMGAVERAMEIDHVTTDNLAVGHLAHEYLSSLGCRDVAFITEFPEWSFMRMRGQTFANAARDSGHRINHYIVTTDARISSHYGPNVYAAPTLEALIDRLAAGSNRPRGIFSSTDRLTLKLYPMLQSRGIVPGRDVHVVSCDNQESLLSLISPRPASVDLRPEEIGRLALERLVYRLEHPAETTLLIEVPPRLGLATV
jgi:LacI family transcriptional regulator